MLQLPPPKRKTSRHLRRNGWRAPFNSSSYGTPQPRNAVHGRRGQVAKTCLLAAFGHADLVGVVSQFVAFSDSVSDFQIGGSRVPCPGG